MNHQSRVERGVEMPKRIQRLRIKGWKMPSNTVYVGRPTKWGNPWAIQACLESGLFIPKACPQICVTEYRCWLTNSVSPNSEHLGMYHKLRDQREWIQRHLEELRGKDLACWCPIDQPCHADVLLEMANPHQSVSGVIHNKSLHATEYSA